MNKQVYLSLGKELEHISSMAPLRGYAGVPITVYITQEFREDWKICFCSEEVSEQEGQQI